MVVLGHRLACLRADVGVSLGSRVVHADVDRLDLTPGDAAVMVDVVDHRLLFAALVAGVRDVESECVVGGLRVRHVDEPEPHRGRRDAGAIEAAVRARRRCRGGAARTASR